MFNYGEICPKIIVTNFHCFSTFDIYVEEGFPMLTLRNFVQRTSTYRQYSSVLAESFYNDEQKELQKTTKKLIETEINPHVEQWETEKIFPAKEVFKKFGDAGLLGINKPADYIFNSKFIPMN